VSESRYIIRPKAGQDLDDHAFFLAERTNSELGHRFLASAHETFALLAKQPHIGWTPRVRNPGLRALRMFLVTGFKRILILYRPLDHGIEVLRVVHGSQNLQRLFKREGVE